MQRLLLVSSLLVALSACSDKSAQRATPAGAAAAAPAKTAAPTELLTRDALFGAAEKVHVLVSPDGAYISWVAPLKGVPNLWVAPIDAPDKARAVTQDSGRGISEYSWSHRAGTLLYKRDQGGDENFHLYALNLAGGSSKDLTPSTRPVWSCTA
ncbi:hypothetical protein CFBP6600_00710 [Xanthomonas arboricola pv. corylina]|nr:hypothetical protein CFBP6600_00710 [Xanthomonas arboricola pv. corylina]CAE6686961.1 hypothetical protein CFBP6600_00710 [Xanthomonas arboricola pv. corylina]